MRRYRKQHPISDAQRQMKTEYMRGYRAGKREVTPRESGDRLHRELARKYPDLAKWFPA